MKFEGSRWLAEEMMDRTKTRTSVLKECLCGALKEYIFEGDHTDAFNKQREGR